MLKQHLIFTDLDGTLLDHYSYSYEPAKPTLNKLRENNIDVIPTTSKTFAEVMLLRAKLSLNTPFIVENGAAVFIPKSHFSQQPNDTVEHQDFWLKSFTPNRDYWLQVLEHKQEFKDAYIGFSQMTDEEISLATGLSLEDAHLANARLFSEPLKWLGTEQQKEQFKISMKSAGANVLQGGRFVHISGKSNKGVAMNWLSQLYRLAQPDLPFCNIALGDSFNDNDMLEAADIAVQIRSVKHDFPTLFRQDNVWQSKHTGPTGWAECLNQILDLK